MIIVYNMNIQMLKGEMFMDEKKEPKYIRGKYSQGQKEATAKYNAKAYDEIKVRVRKGKELLIMSIMYQRQVRRLMAKNIF